MLITISSTIVVNRGDYCKNGYNSRKWHQSCDLVWVENWSGQTYCYRVVHLYPRFINGLGLEFRVMEVTACCFGFFILVRETLESKCSGVTRYSLISPGLVCL